jgi:CHAT domain-containing protein
MRKALHPHEAFASFMIGVHSAYVLLVMQGGLTAQPIQTNADDLAADITALREAFVPKLGKLPDFSLVNANALYRETLGPLTPQLAGIDHLTVAVNGDLASLPFSLLVTTAPTDTRDYVHAAWLIRQTAVTETPSARAFMALRGEARAAQPRPFLGIGNPSFQGGGANQALALGALASACQTAGPADPALLRALQPLPETAAEVQAVGRDLGASPDDILLGDGANETALRAKPLDQYAVLYFATHGMLPGELHCEAQPGLVLSPPLTPAQTTAADGLLTASEIADLKINANLVVLSACNTGAAGGTRFGGGALEGLADAFFNAGAHAVLASHWEVPSAATQALMTNTFANLAKDPKHDAAEALRQAQLALIAQDATAHPFDWAAFTLIGDGA